MDYKMDSGWNLHPIGGDTGQAYMGIRDEEKVFLKRNSSPFLAALSVEGITPRLIWTKRIGNGDVLTAQEWLNGRVLFADEMDSAEIIDLMRRIHRSDNLLTMLKKVKGQVYEPDDFMADYLEDLPDDLKTNTFLSSVYEYLMATKETVRDARYTVCHGDLTRKNFFLTNDERLYLVDWESVKIADPFSDITMLLNRYIHPSEWDNWLDKYGVMKTDHVYVRMNWYGLFNRLMLVKKHHENGHYMKMNQQILHLKVAMKQQQIMTTESYSELQ